MSQENKKTIIRDHEQQRDDHWHANKEPVPVAGSETLIVELIEELMSRRPLKGDVYGKTMLRFVRRGLPWLSKSQLVHAYG